MSTFLNKINDIIIQQESNVSLHKPALEALRSQIRASTSSMTSVPKPLKYLRPHFATLKEIYVEWGDGENKVHCNCDL